MTRPDLDAMEAVAKGATGGQVEFLAAVARFIEAEFVHAKAISDHMEARKGKKDLQDWGHSRDDVDLAHADLMNWPAITADMIAQSLQQQAALLAYIRELEGALEPFAKLTVNGELPLVEKYPNFAQAVDRARTALRTTGGEEVK